MPTYEYVCKSCGHLFEIVQSMRDDALTGCPECGGELRKVFAPPAIAFKGSGFYATDHGKKSNKTPGKKDGSGEPSKDGTSKEGTKPSGDEKGSSSSSSGSTSGSKDGSGSTDGSGSMGGSGSKEASGS
jgi:putative FmdB family regulatory protein